MGTQLKDDDEEVLERIMADGTFDALRHQLLDELRNDAELQRLVEDCIRRSDRLKQAAFEGADDKQLFEKLRHDDKVEQEVTELMIKKVWQSTSGERLPVAATIQSSVHETLCAVYEEREHGQPLPQQPRQ